MSSIDFGRTHGTWEGEEILHPGPGVSERTQARGRTVIRPVLGGAATAADYEQVVGGQLTIHCHTVLLPRGADGEVEMIWTASMGGTQTFHGRCRDGVFRLECEVAGMLQRLEQDFSEDGVMRNRMEMGPDPGSMNVVFEGTYHRRPAPTKAGTIGWHDLTVDDAPTVRDFYAEVVGWTPEPVSMGDYDDYTLLAAAGEPVGGVCHARGANQGLPPAWLLYVHVDDLDASLAACEARGGRIVAPARSMGRDRYAVIADPAGAPCALYQAGD